MLSPTWYLAISWRVSQLCLWATWVYMAQLFRLWKCLSRRRYDSGMYRSPQPRHRCRGDRHSMTFLLRPLEVMTRSNARFTREDSAAAFFSGSSSMSVPEQEGHFMLT